jgi:pyrroline-5-carboxylate reductase
MSKNSITKTKLVSQNSPLGVGGAVSIIGGGNLGKSIALGLVESNFILAKNLTVTRRNTASLQDLQEKGINITSNNKEAIKNASIILLCIKPYQIENVLAEIKTVLNPKQIIISVVTGVSLLDLEKMVSKKMAIFRAMPNTAIAVMQSMTCISHKNATSEQANLVSQLFGKVGRVAIIEDALMDAATVLGACGTAFALRFIRANIQGGIEIGFDSKTASLIAAQTVLGAAELLLQKNTHPEAEIDKVTTPKGCTIAGLNEMEHQGFSSSLIKGVVTSFNKISK